MSSQESCPFLRIGGSTYVSNVPFKVFNLPLIDEKHYPMKPRVGEEEFDYQFKYILFGDSGVGKSAFIRRLIDNTFEEAPFRPKVAMYFRFHMLSVEGRPIKLRIWDFPSISKPWKRSGITGYYYEAVGAIILYDVTRRETFDVVPSFVKEARRYAHANVTIMLVGNKCELENERAVSKEEGEQFAQQNGLLFLEASAATTQNVEEAFKRTAANILEKIHAGAIGVPDPKLL